MQNKSTESYYCLGHLNFGQLTQHVPAANYKVYTDLNEAKKDCAALHPRNPKMRVLVCTSGGTPIKHVGNAPETHATIRNEKMHYVLIRSK